MLKDDSEDVDQGAEYTLQISSYLELKAIDFVIKVVLAGLVLFFILKG